MTNAAIFDLDGTLVDTYEAHFAAWRDLSEAIGHDLAESEFAKQFGRTNDPIIRELFEMAGRGTPSEDEIAELADRKEADFRGIVEHDFPEMPGATHLVTALQAAGWKLAAGTSAPLANADMFQERLGCGQCFDVMVTGDDVTHGKPDPEVFLLAAQRLGVRPNECVVIEDAGAGVEAARRGGMASVGFCSRGRTREELAAADLVIGDLSELTPDRLSELIYSATGAREDR
ncbi:MAG: HAD family phosphatase [Phycisphaerales bacterium]|nr:HAD family phosphatase [Phycisphaerales bacterium]